MGGAALLLGIIDILHWTPRHGVGDPAIEVRFPPAGAVDADPDLGRERTLGDLAIDSGPGQAGPGEDGVQADDTVWCGHGCAGSCQLSLTAPDTHRTSAYARKRVQGAVVA